MDEITADLTLAEIEKELNKRGADDKTPLNESVYEINKRLHLADPDGFNSRHPSIANKLMDVEKENEKNKPIEYSEITEEVLENMSTLENQKLLIIATLPDKHERELFLQSFANLVQTPEEKKAADRREHRAKFNDMAIEKGMWIDEHGEIVTATPEQVERFKATRKPYQDAIEHLERVVFGDAYDDVVEGLHNKPKGWY